MNESRLRIAGIDLAWGERNPDGLCLLEGTPGAVRMVASERLQGDAALLGWIRQHLAAGPALVLVDAPIVCPNPTGSRPVDRLTHVHFGRFKCGCYPANATKCPRPPRVAARISDLDFRIGWDLAEGDRWVAEVYPHPAMVRLFGLKERIPYKKGPVAERRKHFRFLQAKLSGCLDQHFPELERGPEVTCLLREGWTKAAEDRIDAFFCALIGLWHWRSRGKLTQILGSRDAGFLLVPVLAEEKGSGG